MLVKLRWFTVPGALVFAVVLGCCLPLSAQPQPRSLTLASNPPGTVFYALASGLAKVASDGAPFVITVQPYSGTSTFLPLLNNGEVDFGINNAVDMALSHQGRALEDRRSQSLPTYAQRSPGHARLYTYDGAIGP
jgi:TRAP-type uncharacterized transport system substrate-binding protein